MAKRPASPPPRSGDAAPVADPRVLRSDEAHQFHPGIAASQVARIEIVDVDLVLTTRSGARVILQGAALEAFSDDGAAIDFTDGTAPVSSLISQVGEVTVDAADLRAHSRPQPSVSDPAAPGDETDVAGSAPEGRAQVPGVPPVPAVSVRPADLTYTPPPPPAAAAAVSDKPPAQQGAPPNVEASSSQVGVVLLAETGTHLTNGVLFGSYGADGADTNPAASAQMAPEVITADIRGRVVNANDLGGAAFIKVQQVSYTGSGNVTSLAISGLPAGYTIPGATPDANGVYHIDPASHQVAGSPNHFDIPLQYALSDPSATTPVHDSFTLNLSVGVLDGSKATTYTSSPTVVVGDALTAADLTALETGGTTLALPAQGIGYQIHAIGADTVTGGRSNDTIYAAGGGNDLDGGKGVNTLDFTQASGPESVSAVTGRATGEDGVDIFTNFQRIVGSPFDDTLAGATTTLYLGAGGAGSNDLILTGGGGTAAQPETIAGSAKGVTTLSYADATGPVSVDLTTGVETGFGVQAIQQVEILVGSHFDDTLTGAVSTLALVAGGTSSNTTFDPGGGGTSLKPETITGSANGVNTLSFATSAGPVVVDLGHGTATGDGVQSFTNIQQVVGSAFGDSLTGGASTLAMSGGTGGADTFDGGGGGTSAHPETITGSASGDNTLTFAAAPGGVTVDLTLGYATGSYGFETLSAIQSVIGSGSSDSLTGSAGTRHLSGGTGGNDTFSPGGGGTADAPEVIEGDATGVNTLTYAAAPSGVTVNLQTGTATGFGVQTLSHITVVVGSAFDDSLTGTTDTRAMSGGLGGADTFDPGRGGTATAPEQIIGSGSGDNTLTFAADTLGSIRADLTTGLVDGGGPSLYGYVQATNIQYLVGSAYGGDVLKGSAGTLSLAAGPSTLGDTFDPGGGGTAQRPETVSGSATGVNTLTFAGDTVHAIDADLSKGTVDAGDTTGYGVVVVDHIQRLVGSALGGDTLIGGPGVLSVSAGSASASDTFDGGGGGRPGAVETLTGSTGGTNTLSFAGDQLAVGGGVNVDLRSGIVTGGYGLEQVSGMSRVIGSAFGADSLVGLSHDDLEAGGGASTLVAGSGTNTLVGGSGADSLDATSGSNLVILGGGNATVTFGLGNDTLSFARATGPVVVDLARTSATGFGNITLTGPSSGLLANLVGSRFDDQLTGLSSTRTITAGSDTALDTFDGGGGGTTAAAETLTGGSVAGGVASFRSDLAYGPGVHVDLTAHTATGYGDEVLKNIESVYGSLHGDDLLQGDGLDNLLVAGSGNSRLVAAIGQGTLVGGAGQDTLDGTLGTNLILAGSGGGVVLSGGADTLSFADVSVSASSGGATTVGVSVHLTADGGAATVAPGVGLAISGTVQGLIGSAGSDTLTAAPGTQVLSGGSGGDDVLALGGAGTQGAPVVVTGSATGVNTLTFADDTVGGVRANLSGSDRVYGVSGAGTLSAGIVDAGSDGYAQVSHVQRLIGSAAGGDLLVGGSGVVALSAGSETASDTFDLGGETGGDTGTVVTVTGSTGGTNTLTFEADTAPASVGGGVVVDLSHGTVSGSDGDAVISHITRVIGTAFGQDQLIGDGAGDTLIAGGGATTIIAGAGTNLLEAGAGHDSIDASVGHNLIVLGGGDATVVGASATGTGTGSDTLSFALATTAVAADLSSLSASGGAGFIVGSGFTEVTGRIAGLVGSANDDTLTGSSSTLLIDGGGGNDLIDPGGGGQPGASETISMLAGSQGLVSFASSPRGVTVDLGAGTGFGTATGDGNQLLYNVTAIQGTAKDDTLIGNRSTRLLDGGSGGDDSFRSGGGGLSATAAETIRGGVGGSNTLDFSADTVAAITADLGSGSIDAGGATGYGYVHAEGITTLIGSAAGGDLLTGNGNNLLQAVDHAGGPGSRLVAGPGSNTLVGGLAADTLDGSQGANLILAGTAGGSILTGSGADTVSFAQLTSGVVVRLDSTGGGASVSGGTFTLSGAVQGLIGTSQSDTLTGTAGTLRLDGGAGGNDQFDLNGAGSQGTLATVTGGQSGTGNLLTFAADTVGGVQANLIGGTVQADPTAGTVQAGAYGAAVVSGIQRLIGSAAGGDVLIGGPGVTYLSAGNGAAPDTLDGGGGGTLVTPEQVIGTTDGRSVLTFASYTGAGVNLQIDLGAGLAASPDSGSSQDGVLVLSNIHHVIGSAGGHDTLIGDSANDTLEAGGGSAVIEAGTGTSLLVGGTGSSTIDALAGHNLIDGGGGQFVLLETDGNQAQDTLTFANAANAVTVNLQKGTAQGYGTLQIQGGVGGLLGSSHDDILIGSGSTRLIDGGGGNDTIDPGGGGLDSPGGEETIAFAANTAGVLTYASADQGVHVDLFRGVASGAGYQLLQNVTQVVGSAYSDTLIGEASTLRLDGGTGGNDSFQSGGGGDFGALETIQGSSGGINTLDLSGDSVHAISGSLLTSGTSTPTGTLDGGGAGAGNYGLMAVSNIEQLIGSAIGGDSLTGAPGLVLLQAGSAKASDTFDPGGGGTSSAPESVIGGAYATGTLTYASDTATAISANLAMGTVTGDGVQQVSYIQRLYGSAHGGDVLVGASNTVLLAANSGATVGDTFDGGGGGGSGQPQESIIGTLTGVNTLTFASDRAGGVNVDFGSSPAAGSDVGPDVGTATGYGNYALQSIQVVIGTATGHDTLRGGPGVQQLVAGSPTAVDTFDGGGGGTVAAPESIFGGSNGGSVLTFARDAETAGGVRVDLSANQPSAVATGYGVLSLYSIHDIIGSAVGADTLIGDAAGDLLQAGGGAASLRAGAGPHTNTLIGGGGADTLDAGVGNNLIDPGGGPATVIGATSSQSGSDTVTFQQASGNVTVDLSPLNGTGAGSSAGGQPGTATGYGTVTLTGNIAEIIGSTFDDQITGSRSTLKILAGGDTSHDTIDGGGGGTALGNETLVGARDGTTTLTFASMPVNVAGAGVTVNAGGGQAVGTGNGTATGYGVQTFTFVQTVVGSVNSDSLTGGTGVLRLDGGGGGNDTFDSGGAGDSLAGAVTVTGAVGQDNTLTFEHDTVSAVTARLVSGGSTPGVADSGVADAGGAGNYGYVVFTNIDRLIGSALGGDSLVGTTDTRLLGNLNALHGDTFDAGGGGTKTAMESILGARAGTDPVNPVINTLTYLSDTASSVKVDLSGGTATGDGYQALQNIQVVIGSAFGGDQLAGTLGTLSLISGSTLRADTFDGGMGGTPQHPETITGSVGSGGLPIGPNVLSFASDSANGATVDLSQGTANITTTVGVYSLSNIQAVVGSGLSDSLRGTFTTLSLSGGTGGNDTFDGGGGGTSTAPETITGSATGTNTLSFASDSVSGFAFTLTPQGSQQTLGQQTLGPQTLPGFGVLQVTNIEALIGNGFTDTLTGNAATVRIDAGTGANDVIDSGGGGTDQHPETINGVSGGNTTLTFAADTGQSLYADMSKSVETINAEASVGAGGYGYVTAQNIAVLIGSAKGGDMLIGGTATLLEAGSSITADTFDGGGGPATVTLVGSAAVGGTVTFAQDSIGGAQGGVTVNLQGSSLTGGYGVVSGGYGNERLSNIHHVIGSTGGNDILTGDSAGDTLESGAGKGNVTLVAGTGSNLLVAGAGTDSVNALQGTNTILAGSGALSLQLGTGNDTLSFAGFKAPASSTTGGGVVMNTAATVASGLATVFSGLANATITGGTLTGIIGSAFDDSLVGSSTTTLMDGGSGGNDTFVAGGGTMTVTAATGSTASVLSFAQDTDYGGAVTVDLSAGTAKGYANGNPSFGVVFSNIHRVIGTPLGADSLIGDTVASVLTAGNGNASLIAGSGGGTLNGGLGADTLNASKGSSLVNVIGSTATIDGAGTVVAGVADTVSFAGEGAGVRADARLGPGAPIRLIGDFVEIDGSAYADSLVGTAATRLLSGGGGADTLDGGGGGTQAAPETLKAASDSAGAFASFAGDTNPAGVKVDLTQKTLQAQGVGYGFQTLVNIHNIIGSPYGADTIIGDGYGDVLTAGNGNASLVAGAAKNTLNAGTGTDTINAQNGSNLINLIGGAASVLGGAAGVLGTGTSDTLSFAGLKGVGAHVDLTAGTVTGGNVSVTGAIYALIGSAQSDYLRGSTATLSLTGGGGNDSFDGGGAGDASTGRATVAGGGGTALNTLTFANDTVHAVSANLGLNAADAGGAAGYGSYTLQNIQELIGSARGGDTLIGGASARYLGAAPGSLSADTFDGGGGGTPAAVETIDAGSTTNSLLTFANESATGGGAVIDLNHKSVTGTFGTESLVGAFHRVTASPYGNDAITAETGAADTLTAGGGSDTFNAGTGDLILAGGGTGLLVNITGNSANTLSFANDAAPVGGAGITVAVAANGTAETITGFGGAVTVSGGLTALIGSAGNDSLVGSAFTTSLNGGAGGNDTFDGGGAGTAAAPETLTGSATGNNTVTFAADTVGGVTVNLAASGGVGTVSGSYGYETLTNIHNVIGSRNGADSLTGDNAGDALTATGAGSTVIGGTGSDTITAGPNLVSSLGTTGQIDGGGGTGANTLVLDWRPATNTAAAAFDLGNVYKGIHNISTLDLSQNGSAATSYTISSAEILAMSQQNSATLTIKLGANDHLSFSLAANESIQAGPSNTTYIVDSPTHVVATLHVN